MAESPMPPPYRKQALRILLEQTEGWKVVLERCFALCQEQDAYINNPQYSEAVRFDALGKKNGLLRLLEGVYREAEIPSPFDVYYARWLTALRLTPPPDEARSVPGALSPTTPQDMAAGRLQRRRAGGVA